jgi:hypothetical protein
LAQEDVRFLVLPGVVDLLAAPLPVKVVLLDLLGSLGYARLWAEAGVVGLLVYAVVLVAVGLDLPVLLEVLEVLEVLPLVSAVLFSLPVSLVFAVRLARADSRGHGTRKSTEARKDK